MRKLLLIGSLFIARFALAQSMTFSPLNMVPNPSFEDSLSCPTYISQLNRTAFWYTPTSNSPDYYNSCYDTTAGVSADVPLNWMGYQSAHTGDAYAGVTGFYSTPNGRDYMSVKLEDTLILGHRYCVEFFVSLSDSSLNGINFMGAHFSATPDTIYCLPCPFNFLTNLPFQPQIEYASIITDTMGWTKISGSFIATGDECYMTIGVFRPDSVLSLDTIRGDGSIKEAYFYLDDVAVWDCDTMPVVYPVFTLYPNPSGRSFNISGNFPPGAEFRIYNMLGQLVYDPVMLPEGNNNVLIESDLGTGVYYYQIRNAELIAEGKFAVLE